MIHQDFFVVRKTTPYLHKLLAIHVFLIDISYLRMTDEEIEAEGD